MTETCAELARHHDDPLPGTAPRALGWLLVEQPGPWGRDALTASGLDPAIGARLAARAADLPVRVQVVRRPGPRIDLDADGRRTVILTHAGRTPWAEALDIDHDDQLAALDPGVCAEPEPPGLGRAVDGPVMLVCTHAKRDRCCASYGRPIADTLTALHPDLVWESSHVGGHRFAGNLVVLPDGLVYGGLGVAEALETVRLHLAGRIDVAHLRGSSGLDPAGQAAEAYVRAALDEDRLGEVTVSGSTEDGDDLLVELEASGRRVVARLARRPLGVVRALSCDSVEETDPETFRLLSLTSAMGDPSS